VWCDSRSQNRPRPSRLEERGGTFNLRQPDPQCLYDMDRLLGGLLAHRLALMDDRVAAVEVNLVGRPQGILGDVDAQQQLGGRGADVVREHRYTADSS